MTSFCVFDLDGVIRNFDPTHIENVAARYGIDSAELAGHAFSEPLGIALITGAMSRAEWVEAVGVAVGCPPAATEWLSHRGTVDPAMVTLLQDLQSFGTRVALLTNGTDTIPKELASFGIDGYFDVIFNSSVLGVAKPAPEIYQLVANQLGGAQIWFTDDAEPNVVAANEAGWNAELFAGPTAARASLEKCGALSSVAL